MRFLFTILLFFISWISVAQADSVRLKQLASQLDRALVGRDSRALPLSDNTVSRRHAELVPTDDGWIAWAREVLVAIDAGGVTTLVSGEMVDPAMRGRAETIVALAELGSPG